LIVLAIQAVTTPAPQSYDLTGHATAWLAVATFILAAVTTWAVISQNQAVRRGFDFERVRQVPTVVPLLTLRIGKTSSNPQLNSSSWYLQFSNSGMGAACNPRFSSLYNCQGITAAMHMVPSIGPGERFTSAVEIVNDGPRPFHFDEMVIRYEDVFGNLYATEYHLFNERGGDYVWRRPWVGKAFNVPKPQHDSADPPEWGRKGRELVDAGTGRL
jgi:hypothetical protein